MLQWGHGDEAVEEDLKRERSSQVTVLQWGHGDEAVEESTIRSIQFRWEQLQWGHGDEAVEESRRSIIIRVARMASMGPRR